MHDEYETDWPYHDDEDEPAAFYVGDPFLAQHLRMSAYRQRFPEYQVDPWEVSPYRARQLRALPYSEYLRTKEWRAKRRVLIRERGDRCERCQRQPPYIYGSPPPDLHVHHKTYERVGHELPEDLEVLCAVCHDEEHSVAA